jgi:hypothetical protein
MGAGYTVPVLLYKFFPVSLFLVGLGVVYGVTTAVSAQISARSAEPILPPPVEGREVRIAVVSNNPTVTTSPDVGREESETAEEFSEEEPAVVADVSEVEEPLEEADYSATELLASLMSEEEMLENLREIPVRSREVARAVPTVPFYSQFRDISAPSWQKVGCGIASLAMIIDFYAGEVEPVDALLNRGIAANAFLSNAGWIHAGLINLSKPYGLNGKTVSWAHLSTDGAFAELKKALAEGPVMASVHYTFEPTNPIPHLVVITGVEGGKVFYNDPAEASGGGSLSIEKFNRAWKKRYIEIRPV